MSDNGLYTMNKNVLNLFYTYVSMWGKSLWYEVRGYFHGCYVYIQVTLNEIIEQLTCRVIFIKAAPLKLLWLS